MIMYNRKSASDIFNRLLLFYNKMTKRDFGILGNNYLEQSQIKRYSTSDIASEKLRYSISSRSSNFDIKFYIDDVEPVELIMTDINKNLTGNDAFVELGSNKGHLTKRLLSLDKKLIMFQPPDNLVDELNKLYPEKMKNVTISYLDFLKFNTYLWKTRHNPTCGEHHQLIDTLKSITDPSSRLNIIGTLCSPIVFYNLSLVYAFNTSIFADYLHPTLYLYVPDFIYASLVKNTQTFHGQKLRLVLSIFFDVIYLGAQPQSAFKIYGHRKKQIFQSETKLHLLKFVPNDRDLMKKLTNENIVTFYFFVLYFIRLKKATVFIDALEEFIPDIGEELIENGFKAFDNALELSFDMWLRAFTTFTMHPAFPHTIFLNVLKEHFHNDEIVEMQYPDPLLNEFDDLDSEALSDDKEIFVLEEEELCDEDDASK